MGSPGSTPNITTGDVRGFFSQLDPSVLPITTAAVAEKLECPPSVARQHLSDLAERDVFQSTEITGGDRIWWQADDEAESFSFPQQSDHQEFSAFVNAVKDYAIFKLDPDGVVANWNDGAERIKGYTEAEIVGEHFSTFYTTDDTDEGVPERNLEAAVREGRVEDEGWRVRKDGSQFWANVTITAIRDDDGDLQGFTKVTRDMTEQREYEQQLHRERDLTEQILETIPVSICLISSDGEFVRANQRMLDRIGIEESELSEYSVDSWDIYDAEGEPIPTEEWPWTRVTETGDPVSNFRCQVDLPKIGRRWLSMNAAPLSHSHYDQDMVVVSVDDITDQKEYEQQLRRESDQTEQLLRTAPVAIAVQNAAGERLMANQRAQDILGLSEQDFIDEPENADEWTVYDVNDKPVPPDEMPAARVLATGKSVFNQELRIDPPDGDSIRLRANAAPISDSDGSVERVITAAEDITELKKRERQLERRKTELETELNESLNRVSDAFYALDSEYRFTHLNDQAAELLQESEDLLGREVWDLFSDAPDSIYWEKFHTAMETQQPVSFEVYQDELDEWLEFNVYPSESGLSIYFRDITERKKYQQRLEESNERLEQFAYAVSHDLQEPLRMITSYLQLIEDRYEDALDEDGQEFIEFAVDGADRMREMIEGLLAYSRVETQGEPFESVNLDSVLVEVRDDLRLQIEESDAEITAESLPRVEGDRSQLRQVFQNLLDNAIEYSGDGSPRVHMAAEREDKVWRISVSDEGIGIDPDDADRVFEVFERLHSPDEHPGTGIGLALCRRIIERHGGEIWVESDSSDGTTFSFTLPVLRDQ